MESHGSSVMNFPFMMMISGTPRDFGRCDSAIFEQAMKPSKPEKGNHFIGFVTIALNYSASQYFKMISGDSSIEYV